MVFIIWHQKNQPIREILIKLYTEGQNAHTKKTIDGNKNAASNDKQTWKCFPIFLYLRKMRRCLLINISMACAYGDDSNGGMVDGINKQR